MSLLTGRRQEYEYMHAAARSDGIQLSYLAEFSHLCYKVRLLVFLV